MTQYRQPDFQQFLAMVAGEQPERPVLFEHYIDPVHINPALGADARDPDNPPWGWVLNSLTALARLGYDCGGIPTRWSGFLTFPLPEREGEHSVGQFEGGVIHDEASMDAYPWPDPDAADVTRWLDGIATEMPAGMKLLLAVSDGMYDLMVNLLGFADFCYLLSDHPALCDEIARRIGTRSVRIVERCIDHPAIGGVQVCDDWGFKTGTFLRPEDLRRYVFPWHRAIVEVTHGAGKIAVLHACGDVSGVMDAIIDDLRYDAKHSFEDAICPVETMWETYGDRIAILGGLDVDFLARSTPQEIFTRSRRLLERTGGRRYALGSGNSVTPDMSAENYAALRRAALCGG